VAAAQVRQYRVSAIRPDKCHVAAHAPRVSRSLDLRDNGRKRWGALESAMLKLLVWAVLFVLCWPLALLVLVLYPLLWLLSLPFRLVGIAFEGVFALLHAVVMLPARILGGAR